MINFFHKRMRKDQKGFTLVELMVVVTILGILATLAVQTIGDHASTAREKKALADLRTLVSALELYNVDTGGYPVTGGSPDPDTDLAGLTPGYLHKLPNVTTYTSDGDSITSIVVTVGSKTATYPGSL